MQEHTTIAHWKRVKMCHVYHTTAGERPGNDRFSTGGADDPFSLPHTDFFVRLCDVRPDGYSATSVMASFA